ncbi:MAG: hypothetical protein R6U01_10980 [Halorubrum sp.]
MSTVSVAILIALSFLNSGALRDVVFAEPRSMTESTECTPRGSTIAAVTVNTTGETNPM